MKLWLLEILACPIDKAFPLQLTILKWREESSESDPIQKLIEGYQNHQVLLKNMETPLKRDLRDNGELYINDSLVLKPTPFSQYVKTLLKKIEELDIVEDKSSWKGNAALNLIRLDIKKKLETAFSDCVGKNGKDLEFILEKITPSLEFLNILKYDYEIEDGVIQCPQCKRWFPIFESIPQMLPDEVRDKEKESGIHAKMER